MTTDLDNKNELYKGNIIDKKFEYDDIQIKWLTKTSNWYKDSNPFILFESNEILYYAIGDFKFSTFEDYSDWNSDFLPDGYFDYWEPRLEDYQLLLDKSNFIYYEFNYSQTMLNENLDEFCQFEIDIIENWHKRHKRNVLLSELIKKES